MDINKEIRQKSAWTFSEQKFTKIQKDMIYLAIAHLNSNSDTVSFPKSEYDDVVGYEVSYSQIKKALKDVGRTGVVLLNDQTKQSYFEVFIFQSVKLEKGLVSIQFSPRGLNIFQNIYKDFTSMNAKQAIMLKGVYTKRIFELLSDKRDLGIFKIEIQELIQILSIPKSIARSITIIRSRVLDPAFHELQKTAFKPKYELIKTGRKYTHLKITFKSNPYKAPEKTALNIDEWGLIRKAIGQEHQTVLKTLAHKVDIALSDYEQRFGQIKNKTLFKREFVQKWVNYKYRNAKLSLLSEEYFPHLNIEHHI